MKKLLVVLLCILSLCACEKDSGTLVIDEGDEPEWLMGGWYINPELPVINDAYFEAAVKDTEYQAYSPLLVLARQVVAGENIMYLAYSNDSIDGNNSYKLLKIYVDLQNNASVLRSDNFVLTNYLQQIEGSENIEVGSFCANSELANLLDNDTNELFSKAIDGIDGVNYEPVCLLASQVVAGTNYAILAKGTTVTAEPTTNLYIIKIYEALDGNVELSNISQIDLGAFN